MTNQLVTILCLALGLSSMCHCYPQVMIDNDANNNFYSVQMPHSQVSFHRVLQPNGNHFSNFVAPAPQPSVYQQRQQPLQTFQNYIRQPEPQRNQMVVNYQPQPFIPQGGDNLAKYSLSSDVSAVRFSSNGLSYNF